LQFITLLKAGIALMKNNPADTELKITKELLYEEPEVLYCRERLSALIEYKLPLLKSTGNDYGAIQLNKKYACIMKITSSHGNEKTDQGEGASTIALSVREIVKTGARPVACACSLGYGPSASGDQANKLCNYVSDTGIPVIKNNICFGSNSGYDPHTRVMTLGIVSKDRLQSMSPAENGQQLFLMGFAGSYSKDLPEEVKSLPDRLLIEGILELSDKEVISCASCINTSGIIGAAVDLIWQHNLGIRLDIDKITAGNIKSTKDILMSASLAGTIMISVEKTKKSLAEKILNKWHIDFCAIGELIKQNNIKCFLNNKSVADIPLKNLSDKKQAKGSATSKKNENEYDLPVLSADDISEPDDCKEVISELVKQPVIFTKSAYPVCSDLIRGSVDMNTQFPSDSGIVRFEFLNRALTAVISANSQYLSADTKTGIVIMIAKAIRDTICSGSEPLAVSLALEICKSDFNTFREQFELLYDGLEEAIRQFKIPLASFTVSMNSGGGNDKNSGNLLLKPAIGITGELKSAKDRKDIAFRDKGHMIYLIGRSVNDFSSSQYIKVIHGIDRSPAPLIDIGFEGRLHDTVRGLIKAHLIISAHNISEGGLFFSLLESAMVERYGFDITSPAEVRLDSFLFSESQGRVIVTVSPARETEFIDFMLQQDFPFSALGHVTKEELRIDDISYGSVNQYKEIYNLNLKSCLH
jgi:phosphoribosylformylglycinamidine (FGAM) synthase-like enzyme